MDIKKGGFLPRVRLHRSTWAGGNVKLELERSAEDGGSVNEMHQVLAESTCAATTLSVEPSGRDLACTLGTHHALSSQHSVQRLLGKPCITRFKICSSVSCSRPVAISIGKREIGRHIRGDS